MSWAASKAVGPWIQAPRVARLNLRFGIVHYQPRNPARGCIGEPAPVRTRPCDTAQPRARKCSPEKVSPFRKAVQSQLRSFLIETPITKATGCFGGITMHMCPTVVRSEMREIGSLAVFPHHSTGIPGDKRQGEFEATDVLADTCWRACLNCWQGLCACFANCRAHIPPPAHRQLVGPTATTQKGISPSAAVPSSHLPKPFGILCQPFTSLSKIGFAVPVHARSQSFTAEPP